MKISFEWNQKRLSTFAESRYCENYVPMGPLSSAVGSTDWRTNAGLVNRISRTTHVEKSLKITFSGFQMLGLFDAAQYCVFLIEVWPMLVAIASLFVGPLMQIAR